MNISFNINSHWGFYRADLYNAQKFNFDDSGFAAVNLPHAMRLERKFAGSHLSVFQGIGWYRRYFKLDKKYNNCRIIIEFDGVMTDSEIFLNEKLIYNHHGGYMGFCVDISNYVDFENENILAVRVSNKDNPDTPPGKELKGLGFHTFGGIYRGVRMHISDKLYISNPLETEKAAFSGVFVSCTEANKNKATINIKTHIVNLYDNSKDAHITQRLLWNSEPVAKIKTPLIKLKPLSDHTFESEIVIEQPMLWHPNTPNLYTLQTILFNGSNPIYENKEKIGLRRFNMRADGFYINGERLFLRGANRHQCYAYIGDAAPASLQYRDALQIKENGFNAVRAAHYPHSSDFLNACDEIGLLVIACQPGWQNFTGNDVFYKRTIRDIREMIRRDRNHPSIFLWETSLNETAYSKQWALDATAAAHEEMLGDQMFTAADYKIHGDLYDVNYKIIDEINGKYVDHEPEKPVFTREWGDWGGLDQAMRADGGKALDKQVETHQRFLNGKGYPDWGGLDACTRMGGYFLWSWNDYAYGSGETALFSGTVEIDRYKKPLFYWLKSMQNAKTPAYDPMVYINIHNELKPGDTFHVYSNCDSVRLYADKRLLGELSRSDMVKNGINENIIAKGGSPIFLFKLPQNKISAIKAEGIINGKISVIHTAKLFQKAYQIVISADTETIKPVADGSDLIPVYFKVLDKQGTLVKNYFGEVAVSVTGEGVLVGEGIPRIDNGIREISGGIGFAFVRTTFTAGNISLAAKGNDGDLCPAVCTIQSHADTTSVLLPRCGYNWQKDINTLESTFPEEKYIPLEGQTIENIVKNKKQIIIKKDFHASQNINAIRIHSSKKTFDNSYRLLVSHSNSSWQPLPIKALPKQSKPDFFTLSAFTRYAALEITGDFTKNIPYIDFTAYEQKENISHGMPVGNSNIEKIICSCSSEPGRGPKEMRNGETLIGTGWLADVQQTPQSVTIHLKNAITFSANQIYWEKDSTWYRYNLEVSSDNKHWQLAINDNFVGGQNYAPVCFDNAYENIKFIRLSITEVLSGSGVARIGIAEWVLYKNIS